MAFFVALVQTPINTCKMMSFALSTEKVFHGVFGPVLRVVVTFLLVPPLHLLIFVLFVGCEATFGILDAIGQMTALLFDHSKTWWRDSNCFDPVSMIRAMVEVYEKMTKKNEGILLCLNGLFVFACPGLLMALLAMIPFATGITLITIYRLPINFAKTIKIALFTVVLRWDLRILVLLALPLVHALFPLAVFIVTFIGSFFWVWFKASMNTIKGNLSPEECLARLGKAWQEYYNLHERFVSVHCTRYDHPTGIPDGWDGTRYGLPVKQVLWWQLDFLLFFVLVPIELLIGILAVLLLVLIKFIPTCHKVWQSLFSDSDCFLPCWPICTVVAFLVPVGVAIYLFLSVLSIVIMIPSMIFEALIWKRPILRYRRAWNVQFISIYHFDEVTGAKVLPEAHDRFKMFDERDVRPNNEAMGVEGRGDCEPVTEPRQKLVQECWDRFQLQCIQSTSQLLEKRLITRESVNDMDPAVIQSIPSVAVWTILVDTISNSKLGSEDLEWKIDGTHCRDCAQVASKDAIFCRLWPLIHPLLRLLHNHKDEAITRREWMMTFLCSNGPTNTSAVNELLKNDRSNTTQDGSLRWIHDAHTKLTCLVLALLRVQPYQQRMGRIFSEKYEDEAAESQDEEKQEDFFAGVSPSQILEGEEGSSSLCILEGQEAGEQEDFLAESSSLWILEAQEEDKSNDGSLHRNGSDDAGSS